MKIDFNSKGMSIQFDKVPRFLYFNESGSGCGAVFIDGQRIKGLQEINIHAQTLGDTVSLKPLNYSIKKHNFEKHYSEMIESESK